MSKSKDTKETIIIRGIPYDKDLFKPCEINQDQFLAILQEIVTLGEFAKEVRKNIDFFVDKSPLVYIEGLIRFQLQKHDCEKYGINLETLETPSDFSEDELIFHGDLYSPKIEFLFDFLSCVVSLSYYPELIWNELEKLKANLHAYSFLVEPQITGSKKDEDIGFIGFDFFVFAACQQIEKEMGGKIEELKVSGRLFWDMTLSMFNNEESWGFIEFTCTNWIDWRDGSLRTDTFDAQVVLNKSDEEKSFATLKTFPLERKKDVKQLLITGQSLEKNILTFEIIFLIGPRKKIQSVQFPTCIKNTGNCYGIKSHTF